MAYIGEIGWRREPTRECGEGGGRVAIRDFKRAKKKFYSTLKVDRATHQAIKLYNQIKNMW
jgi:hypothetical protein